MKMQVVIVAAVIFLLTACGTSAVQEPENSAPSNNEVVNTKAENVDGEFTYRIVSEKAVYEPGESVKLYAELEYNGEKEKITIYHASSPFYFPMVEKERGYEMGYSMTEPLVTTTLTKGEPVREEYNRTGSYGSNDPQEYVAFMKKFLEEGFPEGLYTVNGYADFFVKDGEGNQRDYRIGGDIEFKVLE